MRALRLLMGIGLSMLLGCGGDGGGGGDDGGVPPGRDGGPGDDPPLGGLYTSAVSEIRIEIDYETGAEPYTGTTLTSGDPWDLFEANLGALFSEAPRTLTFPRETSGMEDIGAVTGEDHDIAAILAIAGDHRDLTDGGGVRTFYFVFLEGYYSEGGARLDQVLGVSIGDTGVIAMFKPVIRSTGGLTSDTPRFVEQTTLIHEFGHAAGLVNNGVPLTSAHQDAEHGAHCSNTDCVMYWLNEGAGDIAGFVTRRITSGVEVLFGEECLADARAAAR